LLQQVKVDVEGKTAVDADDSAVTYSMLVIAVQMLVMQWSISSNKRR